MIETKDGQIKRKIRSHTCGQLNASDVGKEVTLCGWVATRRNLGGVLFMDLRDRHGVTQIIFDSALPGGADAHNKAQHVRSEFVIWCKGKVRPRPEGMANTQMATGGIEVACTEFEVFSEAKTTPFVIGDEEDVSETLRLKYRYLDLRRPSLQKNLLIRHKFITAVRNYLNENDFIEVETPILYKSTPEGARDFIVPSRINPGTFYALPQSPQTLKQLLMIAGMDRYYQIARCFRDEDLRADRQPEFTQIDIETSFLDEEALYGIIEGLVSRVWKEVPGESVEIPFLRMPYREAMTRFGSDKPDIRFGLEMQDVYGIFNKSEFRVFQSAKSIRAVVVKGQAEKFSRKDLDDLQASAARFGAKGLLWIKVKEAGELNSPSAKFFSNDEKANLSKALNLETGDLVLMIADAKDKVVCTSLGAVRLDLGERLGLIPKVGEGKPAFLWVTEFPLLEYDDALKRYFACHHPFTLPHPDDLEKFLKGEDLENIRASAYDLVMNGVEIAGGSLRIYRNDVQQAMFKALGISVDEAKDKFGFFLEALEYGTPPHGGIAFGVERLAAMLCGVGPIRDVMAFPKTQKGHCLMSESPSSVSPEQLKELGIGLVK